MITKHSNEPKPHYNTVLQNAWFTVITVDSRDN